MHCLKLPGGNIETTQLGFGCAYLSPENSAVLDAAYDAGIRHFDVARAYARGLAESVLGKFLKRHPADITITSKYGITPPFRHPVQGLARTALRPIVQRLRRSKTLQRGIEHLPGARNRKASFHPEDARNSLRISLQNLGVDRIHVYLMHEPSPEDLLDPRLRDVLVEAVQQGRIGAYGIGGPRSRMQACIERHPAFCGVLQYDWTALDPVPVSRTSSSIVYRTYSGPVEMIRDAIRHDRNLCRQWSDDIGQDLSQPDLLGQLMLNAALTSRPDTLVLFSSSQPARVLANVAAATDRKLTTAALRLIELAGDLRASGSPHLA